MENEQQMSRTSSIAIALDDLPADVWRRLSERLSAIRRSQSRSSTPTAVKTEHEVAEGLLVNFDVNDEENFLHVSRSHSPISTSSSSGYECVGNEEIEEISDAEVSLKDNEEVTWVQLDEEQSAALDSYRRLLEERRQIIESRERDVDAEMRDFLELVGVEFDDVLETLAKIGHAIEDYVDISPSVESLVAKEVDELEKEDRLLLASRKDMEEEDEKEGGQEFSRHVTDKEREFMEQSWREQLGKYRRQLTAYRRAFDDAKMAACNEHKERLQIASDMSKIVTDVQDNLLRENMESVTRLRQDLEQSELLSVKRLGEIDRLKEKLSDMKEDNDKFIATADKARQEVEMEREELKRQVANVLTDCATAFESRKNAEMERDELKRCLTAAQSDCATAYENRKEVKMEQEELKQRVTEVLQDCAIKRKALKDAKMKQSELERQHVKELNQCRNCAFEEIAFTRDLLRVQYCGEIQLLKAALNKMRADTQRRVDDALNNCAAAHEARQEAVAERDELRRRHIEELNRHRKSFLEELRLARSQITELTTEKKQLARELAIVAEQVAAKQTKEAEAQSDVEKVAKPKEASCKPGCRHSYMLYRAKVKNLEQQLTDALTHRAAEKSRWDTTEVELNQKLDMCRAECSVLKDAMVAGDKKAAEYEAQEKRLHEELDNAQAALTRASDAYNHSMNVKHHKYRRLVRRVEAITEELAAERAKRRVRERKYIDALAEMASAAERLNIACGSEGVDVGSGKSTVSDGGNKTVEKG